MEKAPISGKALPEELIISKLVERFSDFSVPYKIRKTELLQSVGLPIPETHYFTKDNIDDLDSSAREILAKTHSPLVVRFACIPDRLSMPVFYIENESQLPDVLKKVNIILKDNPEVASIILQEATPRGAALDKISGRFLLDDSRAFPRESVLELYKGNRSTGILNRLDPTDSNYLRFEKELGKFMSPTKRPSPDSLVTKSELKDIYSKLEQYKDLILLTKEIIALSHKQSEDKTLVSLEFSYRSGRMIFTDFD